MYVLPPTLWSSKSRSFIGVTCHWLDKDLKRHSVALACQRFAGIHSYDRIAETLEDIHKKYNLDTTKLLATVTDNGFNFVKCFKEFGLNIVNKKHSTEEDSDFEEKEDEVVFNPIILSDSESTLDSSNFTQERYLPQHIRCASP
ncbi:unnamed protein product [Psylliodes chrysocephalus]|uniref:Transposase n=1 Tax=Psylliodes chrysocephalus TaxID=3402493 RepID=A0A9P0G908_9CUCU|nr:unnamed protein product [Psylliodes chrysocephala]